MTEPFQWGDTTVAEHYRTVLGLGFYLIFTLIICIAPVFASENESGASGILLTARHGKGKMIRAKLIASMTFAFGYVGIGYLASCLGLLTVLGTDGFDLPVQLLDNAIPYQMNMGQLLLLQLLVSFTILFFATILILFFSALTKSSLGTMAIMLFVLVGPAFLVFSKNNRLWNQLLALTTVRFIDLKECLGTFIDYRIGKTIVGLVPFSIGVHIISSLVLAIAIRKTFVVRSLQG